MDPRIERLEAVIRARKSADPASSYVASLFSKGLEKIAQKVGEEATETIIAALGGDRDKLVGESADLLFHMLVLLVNAGISPDDVIAELERREGISGIDEKTSRKG